MMQGMFQLVMLILFCGAFLLLGLTVQLHRRGTAAGNPWFLCGGTVLILAACTSDRACRALTAAGIPLVLFFLVTEILCFRGLSAWTRRNLNRHSILESFRVHPLGMIYYWPDGIIKFLNPAMQRLARSIFGEQPQDGRCFLSDLKEGAPGTAGPVYRGEKNMLWELQDGSVWQFTPSVLTLEKQEICEIVAANITEEYRLHEELNSKSDDLQRIRERLKRYSAEMAEFTREKEILGAKIRVHDEMGKLILTAKRYLEYGDPAIGRDEIMRLWDRAWMRYPGRMEKTPDSEEGAVQSVREAAEYLGLKLELSGKISELDYRQRTVFMTAAGECFTNAFRHGGAKTVRAEIRREGGLVRFTFSNDGKTEGADPHKGGGLRALQQSVRDLGGSMEISVEPEFTVKISLPEK